MRAQGRLLARVEPSHEGRFVGRFISSQRIHTCPPAEHLFDSELDARCWIEHQARQLRLDVEWMAASRARAYPGADPERTAAPLAAAGA